jgi:BirA family biotin operon repressor/biotin-[acetyl-CoA-carboxylase] ligase
MADNQPVSVWHLTVLDQVDSTQDWVRRNLSTLPDRTVVLASSQTSGRGRLGRAWQSPCGGLYASLLIKPAPPPEYAPRVSLALAASVAECLLRRSIPAMIKWPNDVLVDGRKLAGILAEAGGYREPWLILGIGVNIAGIPDVPGRAVLPPVDWSAFGTSPAPRDLLDELLSQFDVLWPGVHDDPLLRASGLLSERLWMKNRRVCIASGRERLRGIVRGISGDGGLVMETETGERVFHSGELKPL